MGKVFAYARVSTPRQGKGVSLPEQRDAIARYAERQGLEIVRWFEELETASQQGRSEFNQMLRLLRLGVANGVVIHKIDRSVRNLEDWNDIGKLVDAGVDVHFATESIDLKSTSGRLSADIQAVVATYYSRNPREEVKKGSRRSASARDFFRHAARYGEPRHRISLARAELCEPCVCG